MMTGAEIFVRALSESPPERRELLDWLCSAGRAYQSGEDLVTALGLTRSKLTKARDSAMAEAARILGADGCSVWVLAGRLSEQVERFESRYWPRIRVGLPVDSLGPADAALQRVFQASVRVISSQRQVYAWLQKQGFTDQSPETGQ